MQRYIPLSAVIGFIIVGFILGIVTFTAFLWIWSLLGLGQGEEIVMTIIKIHEGILEWTNAPPTIGCSLDHRHGPDMLPCSISGDGCAGPWLALPLNISVLAKLNRSGISSMAITIAFLTACGQAAACCDPDSVHRVRYASNICSGRKAETTKLGTSTSSLTLRSTATEQIT